MGFRDIIDNLVLTLICSLYIHVLPCWKKGREWKKPKRSECRLPLFSFLLHPLLLFLFLHRLPLFLFLHLLLLFLFLHLLPLFLFLHLLPLFLFLYLLLLRLYIYIIFKLLEFIYIRFLIELCRYDVCTFVCMTRDICVSSIWLRWSHFCVSNNTIFCLISFSLR